MDMSRGGGGLLRVVNARSILKTGTPHAQSLGLARHGLGKHPLRPRSQCFPHRAVATSLADLVTRAKMASLTLKVLPVLRPNLEAGCRLEFLETPIWVESLRRPASRASNTMYKVIILVSEAGVNRCVRVARVQDASTVCVNDDGRIAGRLGLSRS